MHVIEWCFIILIGLSILLYLLKKSLQKRRLIEMLILRALEHEPDFIRGRRVVEKLRDEYELIVDFGSFYTICNDLEDGGYIEKKDSHEEIDGEPLRLRCLKLSEGAIQRWKEDHRRTKKQMALSSGM